MTRKRERPSTPGHDAGPKTSESTDSDGDLVLRVLGGDHEAYGNLVYRHQDSLYAFALRMVGAPDTAKDLVQSALIKAYQSLRQCQEPERFGPWVFRILSNRCKDYLKSRRGHDRPLEDTWADTRADPAEEAFRGELGAKLDLALRRLPASQREAFILKHLEGLSYEEIADLLGTSVGSLKMRVYRARETLRESLRDLF